VVRSTASGAAPCPSGRAPTDQDLELLVGLVGVGEEPQQDVQGQLVGQPGQLGDLAGLGIGDDRRGVVMSKGWRR
jgi:hypothetical protein